MNKKSKPEQMKRLCELREQRHKRDLAEQRLVVAQAEKKRLQHACEVEILQQQESALLQSEQTFRIRELRDNQVTKRWLKYDDEKARYLLAQAEDDLQQQTRTTAELNTHWKRTQDKHIRLMELLGKARKYKS